MKFGDKLGKMMERRGFNQPSLAKAVGTHQPQVFNWLRKGVVPTMPLALRVARVLGVPLDYLMDDDMDEPPASEMTSDEREIIELYRAIRIGKPEALRRLTGPGAEGWSRSLGGSASDPGLSTNSGPVPQGQSQPRKPPRKPR